MSLTDLEPYTTSDISDALNELGIEHYIPNINLLSNSSINHRLCGPAHTVEFSPVSLSLPPLPQHHVDMAKKDCIIVIKTPTGTVNAVWGGLMTSRAQVLGVKGAIIEGKVRDQLEILQAQFPCWSSGTSVMGAGPFVRVSSIGEGITLGEGGRWPVVVNQDDIMVADIDGVVRIPKENLTDVVRICEKRTKVDEQCLKDIKGGATIKETFAKWR